MSREDRLQVYAGSLRANGLLLDALGEELLHDRWYRSRCRVRIRRSQPSTPNSVCLLGRVRKQEVSQEGISNLGCQPQRPALHQPRDLSRQLGLGLLPHSATPLGEASEFLHGVEDFVTINPTNRVPQLTAQQAHVCR